MVLDGGATGAEPLRVVIDTNRLQSEELAAFLSSSAANRAVITDWVMIEAYKGDTLNSIYKSMSVLSDFPHQVVVLKNAGMCMKVRPGPQMANRLIWREHTVTFAGFISELDRARAGDRLIEDGVLWRGRKATERMEELLEHATDITDRFQEMARSLTQEDIKAIRGVGAVPPDLLTRIRYISGQVGAGFREAIGDEAPELKGKRVLDTFLFRVGTAMTCWFIDWVRTGSQVATRTAKLRNDYADAVISTYGTYFNGVMTKDKKLRDLHSVHRYVLYLMGARMPPPYHNLL